MNQARSDALSETAIGGTPGQVSDLYLGRVMSAGLASGVYGRHYVRELDLNDLPEYLLTHRTTDDVIAESLLTVVRMCMHVRRTFVHICKETCKYTCMHARPHPRVSTHTDSHAHFPRRGLGSQTGMHTPLHAHK